MNEPSDEANVGLLSPLLADGRHFLTLGTLGLLFSGMFALFLAASGQFLPHDIHYLRMSASELCSHDACRIVHFMIHDRVSFGGILIALSILFFWLIHFPLRQKQPWAWWTLCLSNGFGFASFLSYLGFGYLDTWHGLATLFLLPCFVIGLWMTYRSLPSPRSFKSILQWRSPRSENLNGRRGRVLMLTTATVVMAAGFTIGLVGMSVVFVPQDLQYMGTTISRLNELNPRLIPLIAHDRAGFGAGVLNVGFLTFACVWFGAPSRHLWQALTCAAIAGFTAAIGIHPIVGYNNPVHLAPACLGAISFIAGLWLSAGLMLKSRQSLASKSFQ